VTNRWQLKTQRGLNWSSFAYGLVLMVQQGWGGVLSLNDRAAQTETWVTRGCTSVHVQHGCSTVVIVTPPLPPPPRPLQAKAPPLEEEPPLELPVHAELPRWEDYKPVLQPLPTAPTLPVLRTPPFRAPILETEVGTQRASSSWQEADRIESTEVRSKPGPVLYG
jgi:hypothetical protein